MKIIFMGTPAFAVPSLDILVKNGYNIVAVVTTPDKPAGRGQQLQESAVKKYAVAQGLKVLQPEKLKDENFINELRALKADLQLVVAFRMLPEAVWHMPKYGTYNLHSSLLPRYRGAAPINWALINGDNESGVTIFKLQHAIDTGSVLMQEKVKISETTDAGELHDTLMILGAETILKSVVIIEKGHPALLPQDDKEATHAPKIFKDDCRLNWNKPMKEIYNLVRGLSPYPAAFTEFKDHKGVLQSMKIFVTEKEMQGHHLTNGLLVTDNKTFIKAACEGGYLQIKELQLQGKKRMKAEEFLRGYKFLEETQLI